MNKFILTGSQPTQAYDTTVGKSYGHVGGVCFYDDANNLRNIGPHAWKPDNNIINPDAVGSPMNQYSDQAAIEADELEQSNQYAESREPTVMDGLYDENIKHLRDLPLEEVCEDAGSACICHICEPELTEQEQVDLDEVAYQEACDATSKGNRQFIISKSICFGTQEDGSHYTDMQLQPLQACYLRYGLEGLRASIHTKIDKYISRKKNDDVVQLKKAAHCMSILVEIAELEQ